ncbi:hypothetical protein [Marinomonas sp. GJ51-6]|uniref:hypothetical protein n=1 Tax=Marinomonas sp. GJ51-6 TaxID=2992802 RepID=UPI0029346F5B|nr:hypothetical protein [Marinomonas sp. GJ51-6]WOD06188.1 hypothetical protein ONZ50_10615 [Marinomonas sp. GJ51-6]
MRSQAIDALHKGDLAEVVSVCAGGDLLECADWVFDVIVEVSIEYRKRYELLQALDCLQRVQAVWCSVDKPVKFYLEFGHVQKALKNYSEAAFFMSRRLEKMLPMHGQCAVMPIFCCC